ncbi:MAG TPA: glycosyltransferase family 2 protein [Candidatus Omnitrophota bacterium]|nr:glycosyltransferase family 2 protein [Candidatus Omnitrophota bacterium]
MIPSISCVIPTRGRPQLVRRAVDSALGQTLPPAEVIVVVDGPDPATMAVLARIDDPRLVVIESPVSQGPAMARNRGVEAASGEWIALLDDDDYWLPDKLARQAETARRSRQSHPIVSCRVIARTGRGDFVWPKDLPGNEPLGNYLIERRTPLGRPGYVATPTLFVRRDMLLAVPFPALDDHEDWGWLLEAAAAFQARVEMVDAPLCVVTVAEHSASRSKRNSWEASLDWAERYRLMLTPRAYSAFLATKVAGKARRQGAWRVAGELLRRMRRHGRPTALHLLLFLATWVLPPRGHLLFQIVSFGDSKERISP